MCASFLWRQHQAGKAGKEEDEQRDSFLGGRKLDRLCISEKREVRRNTRDQQLTAEIEMCEEHFLLSESWVGSQLFQWRFPPGSLQRCHEEMEAHVHMGADSVTQAGVKSGKCHPACLTDTCREPDDPSPGRSPFGVGKFWSDLLQTFLWS